MPLCDNSSSRVMKLGTLRCIDIAKDNEISTKIKTKLYFDAIVSELWKNHTVKLMQINMKMKNANNVCANKRVAQGIFHGNFT